jgi:lipopolysaccharide transport system permease protein
LEILPVVALGAALFHFFISMIVWLLFCLIFLGTPPHTALLLPIIVFPLLLFTLGITWILASLGVFLRDVGQVISILTMALMFLSPIFYPISALPEEYQGFMMMNPMTPVVEAVRNALIWGKAPDWLLYGQHTLTAAVVAWLGFTCFQKMRKGFADVL